MNKQPIKLNNMALFGVTDLLGTGLNNTLAARREGEARKENFEYNEKAAQNADKRTRALYADLQSPTALLQQYKDAGLSPSLMFANGGTSGATPASGAEGDGASGISPNVFGVNAANAALIDKAIAETENIKADTANKKGEGAVGAAQVKDYLASAGLKEAEKHYNESLKAGADLQNYITEHTTDFQISTAYSIAEKASHEIKTALFTSLKTQQEAELFADTYEEQIKAITYENKLKLSQVMLNKSLTKLNDAEREKITTLIDKWENEVQQGWANVYISALRANTEQERNKIIDDYFDGQIQNLENRLEFDKNKFSREMRYNWITYGLTFLNDNNHYFGDKLMELVPSLGTKKPSPIGFR